MLVDSLCCILCQKVEENLDHILWTCEFVRYFELLLSNFSVSCSLLFLSSWLLENVMNMKICGLARSSLRLDTVHFKLCFFSTRVFCSYHLIVLLSCWRSFYNPFESLAFFGSPIPLLVI